MFQQVPMVEIDGMKLVQTRAILNYIAAKYNLYGKDIKERALIDIYSEGVADLNEIILHYPFLPPGDKDGSLTQIKEKSRNFPAFEKALKTRVSNLPTVKKFLQPGSQRKPFEDEKFVEELKKSFG
ncbi:glutathione S-transferase alpha-3-like isoform X2 [Urocitellus parryii]